MTEGEALALPAEAAEAAKGYLRAEGAGEDGLIAGLVLSAAELCEGFTGQTLIARTFTQPLETTGGWQRLGCTPVRAIVKVEDGETGATLALADYAVDIDANGDGWVRVGGGAPKRIRVSFEAGLSAQWADLPAALRQGIVRLASHFYAHRAAEPSRAQEPPAAVTALWRGFRRMRLR
ncbi:MAG TPA: hypothetical protein VGB59_10320 [Allosphingosinicella sp.]|jgi:uncharacterized phiE125 gp8 family phage protein